MAEETSELSPSLQAKRSTHAPRTTSADTLAITFEVEEDFDRLSKGLRDIVYGEEYGPGMASAAEGRLRACVKLDVKSFASQLIPRRPRHLLERELSTA